MPVCVSLSSLHAKCPAHLMLLPLKKRIINKWINTNSRNPQYYGLWRIHIKKTFVRNTQVTNNWNITSGPDQLQAYYTKLRISNLSFFTPLLSYFIFRSFLFCYSWKYQCITNMNAIWEPQNSKSCLLSNYVFLQITPASCITQNTHFSPCSDKHVIHFGACSTSLLSKQCLLVAVWKMNMKNSHKHNYIIRL
jgi:hypothetical protein